MAGARVKIGGTIRTTDSDGYYSLAIAGNDANQYTFEVAKSGYAPFLAVFSDNRVDAVDVLRPATTVAINPAAPARVRVANNETYIDLPANSLRDANGNAPSGPVNVTVAYYGPSNMPGGTTAVDSSGRERYLVTLGAFYIDAESNGVSYDLAQGATATAFVALPSEYGGVLPTCPSGPCQIGAWQLGTDNRWYERGVVTIAAGGTTLTLSKPAASATAIPITRGMGTWNADVAFDEPACAIIQFENLNEACFGSLGSTGYPGVTLNLSLPTAFGGTYNKTETVNDPNATFVVVYNLLATTLGSPAVFQNVGISFAPGADASLCASRLVVDSSPRAVAGSGFPQYIRTSSPASGGGGTTRVEPGSPWGGTGNPGVTKLQIQNNQHPCRSTVVFRGQ